MQRIAIMQGRLVPPEAGKFQCFPRERWRDEFAHAASAGIDAIEWIYDLHGADANPLASDAGIVEMRNLGARYGIAVLSCCADYFMDRPLVKTDDTDRLIWLLGRCQAAGITRTVLPFVDASRIETAEQETRVVEMLGKVLPYAERAGVEIHLETSYGPADFARLLERLPHRMLKANYDSGNSSALGYDVREEFAAYGGRVGSVHIKDRVRGGGTVPLGTGDADVPALFECLERVGYAGDFVLQVARGAAGHEVAWARQNRAFVAERLSALAGGAR